MGAGEKGEGPPPVHAYKFTAASQHVQSQAPDCSAPVLLKMAWGAGHSIAATPDRLVPDPCLGTIGTPPHVVACQPRVHPGAQRRVPAHQVAAGVAGEGVDRVPPRQVVAVVVHVVGESRLDEKATRVRRGQITREPPYRTLAGRAVVSRQSTDGRMFWFIRNRFDGSQRALIAASRAKFAP